MIVIYPDNFEHKIEFNKIRDLLNHHCLSTLGREKVEDMQFSSDYDLINKHLSQVDEFVHILQEEDSFPQDNFYDVRPILRRVRAAGSWIEQSALSELNKSLKTIAAIVKFFADDEEKQERYPFLHELSQDIFISKEISRKIEQIIDDFGQIRDNASPKLRSIRSEISSAMSGISRTLNSKIGKAHV